ncbi:sigma-70 family RNA polymerase sigma factor, partial [Escherichia coli]|nr:sigma-70 family RNA polymerase sigma factor [Escherichia coli]
DPEALVRRHLPLVRRIAWHIHGSMSSLVEVEDLIQVGLVALIEAAAGFEDRGQVTFEQYLATRLRGAMIDELRRQATTTRGAMRRRKAYQEAISVLTNELGR